MLHATVAMMATLASLAAAGPCGRPYLSPPIRGAGGGPFSKLDFGVIREIEWGYTWALTISKLGDGVKPPVRVRFGADGSRDTHCPTMKLPRGRYIKDGEIHVQVQSHNRRYINGLRLQDNTGKWYSCITPSSKRPRGSKNQVVRLNPPNANYALVGMKGMSGSIIDDIQLQFECGAGQGSVGDTLDELMRRFHELNRQSQQAKAAAAKAKAAADKAARAAQAAKNAASQKARDRSVADQQARDAKNRRNQALANWKNGANRAYAAASSEINAAQREIRQLEQLIQMTEKALADDARAVASLEQTLKLLSKYGGPVAAIKQQLAAIRRTIAEERKLLDKEKAKLREARARLAKAQKDKATAERHKKLSGQHRPLAEGEEEDDDESWAYLSSDYTMHAAGAGALAVLALAGWQAYRRKRAADEYTALGEDEASPLL